MHRNALIHQQMADYSGFFIVKTLFFMLGEDYNIIKNISKDENMEYFF
jgi:hypothetical protein